MLFVDANIFLHLVGRDDALRKRCRAGLDSALLRPNGAAIDAEVLQEVLHVCRRRGRNAEAAKLFDTIVALGFAVLPIELETMQLARALCGRHPGLSTRDAVHAAAIQRADIREILSFDRGFDAVPGLVRREPAK